MWSTSPPPAGRRRGTAVSAGHPAGTLRRMEETTNQHRPTEGTSDGSGDEPRAEAAARAVARMLANPRRTRRN